MMMIVPVLLVAALPTALPADVTYAAQLHASASSATSPTLMTVGQVAFGNGYTFTTRGFNGGIPGPTLRMSPGETFYITLKNELQASNDKSCGDTGTEYCETATTNFHTHGLHISSKGKEDGLSYYSDDVFARVEPGASEPFQFTIPDNHMGGTHWYHPHVHHATALQAGGGAAGVFIVEDPVGYLPHEYSSMTEKVLFISGHNLVTLQSMAVDSQSTLMASAADNARANNLDTNLFLVNGQIGPTMTISSQGWYRLRLVYAAVEQSLQLVVAGDATCQTKLLAKDGVYLTTMPRDVTTIYLYPGARADIALSCTCQTYPCSTEFQSSSVAGQPGGPGGPPPQGGGRRMQPRPRPPPPPGMGQGGQGPANAAADPVNVTVMQIVVTEASGGSTTLLPTVSLQRPCYLVDLQSASPDSTGTLALNGGARRVQWNGVGLSMTYNNIITKRSTVASGGTMSDWPALTTFTTGTIQELVVTGANAHPLHLHVNPYQIIQMPQNSIGDGYFQVGDWHDTLLVEGANSITVRMNMDTFTGKLVVHCHILEHEDEGMMGWIQVDGTEGAKYGQNKQLDSNCYDSAQEMTTLPPIATTTSATTSTLSSSSVMTSASGTTTSDSASGTTSNTVTTSDIASSTTSDMTTTSDSASGITSDMSTTSESASGTTSDMATTSDSASSTSSGFASTSMSSQGTNAGTSTSGVGETSITSSTTSPSITSGTLVSTSTTSDSVIVATSSASASTTNSVTSTSKQQDTTTTTAGDKRISGNLKMTIPEDQIDAAIADPSFKDGIEQGIADSAQTDKQYVSATLSKENRLLADAGQRRLAATMNVAYTITLPASQYTPAQQEEALQNLEATSSADLTITVNNKLTSAGSNYVITVTSKPNAVIATVAAVAPVPVATPTPESTPAPTSISDNDVEAQTSKTSGAFHKTIAVFVAFAHVALAICLL